MFALLLSCACIVFVFSGLNRCVIGCLLVVMLRSWFYLLFLFIVDGCITVCALVCTVLGLVVLNRCV